MKAHIKERDKLRRWFISQDLPIFRVFQNFVEKGSKAFFSQNDPDLSIDEAWELLEECLNDYSESGGDFTIQLAANPNDYAKPYQYFRLVPLNWNGGVYRQQAPPVAPPVAIAGAGIGTMEILTIQQQSFNAQQDLHNKLAEERQKAAILEMKLERERERTKEAERKNSSAIGTAIGEISKTPEAIPAIIQGLVSIFQKNAQPQPQYQQPPQYAAVAGAAIIKQDIEEEAEDAESVEDMLLNFGKMLEEAGEDTAGIIGSVLDIINYSRQQGISGGSVFEKINTNKETLIKFI